MAFLKLKSLIIVTNCHYFMRVYDTLAE